MPFSCQATIRFKEVSLADKAIAHFVRIGSLKRPYSVKALNSAITEYVVFVEYEAMPARREPRVRTVI